MAKPTEVFELMGLRDNDRSEERKKGMREQAAIKEASNTGSIEQRAVAQKQEEKKQSNNKLFDVEGAKRAIKQTLSGKVLKEGWTTNPKTGEAEYKTKVKEKEGKPLTNEKGAHRYIDIAKQFLNENTITSFQTGQRIEKKCKGTIKEAYIPCFVNFHIFDIAYEDMGAIISTIRSPMVDATYKAQGGRMIRNQEQIRVEKESISREGKNEEDDDDRSLF